MRKLILPIDYQAMVADFMRASNQLVATEKREITLKEAELRYSLYQEEVEELETAIKENNRVEQLDAIADCLYILLGTANTGGVQISEKVVQYLKLNATLNSERGTRSFSRDTDGKNLPDMKIWGVLDLENALESLMLTSWILCFETYTIQEAFIRVHVSNMSKFCTTRYEAAQTVTNYREKEDTNTYFKQVANLFIVLREEDDKVMKSINYTPVDLKDLVQEEDQW